MTEQASSNSSFSQGTITPDLTVPQDPNEYIRQLRARVEELEQGLKPSPNLTPLVLQMDVDVKAQNGFLRNLHTGTVVIEWAQVEVLQQQLTEAERQRDSHANLAKEYRVERDRVTQERDEAKQLLAEIANDAGRIING